MQVLSNSKLKQLSLDDLKRLFLDVRSRININKSKGTDSIDLEIYFCYISQELQDRQEVISNEVLF